MSPSSYLSAPSEKLEEEEETLLAKFSFPSCRAKKRREKFSSLHTFSPSPSQRSSLQGENELTKGGGEKGRNAHHSAIWDSN